MNTKIKIMGSLLLLGGILNLVLQANSEHVSYDNKIHALENELQRLRQAPKRIPTDLNPELVPPNETNIPTNEITSAAKEKKEPEQTTNFIEHQKLKAERLRELFNNNKEYDLNKAMNEKYDSEEYLADWAVKREQAITEIFEKNIIIQQGCSIKSISCHSKHCKIELFYQSVEDIAKVSSELGYIIAQQNNLFVSTTDISYLLENKVASIYLTDDITANLY